MTPSKQDGGTAAVQTDEEAGTVALGATIDGVFVPFYTLPKSQVDSLVESGKAKAEADAQASQEA